MSTLDTSVEQMKKRYELLSHKKTAAETNLKNAEERLRELQEQAERDYGTSDIGELEKKLEVMNAENESKTTQYEAHLNAIEQKLNEIEADPKISQATEDVVDGSGGCSPSADEVETEQPYEPIDDPADMDYDPFAEE